MVSPGQRTCKSIDATSYSQKTCVRTSDGWSNGSQVAKSRTFHAYTDDLQSTCIDVFFLGGDSEKLASTCVRIWTRRRNEERKLKTCVDLRVRLTNVNWMSFPQKTYFDGTEHSVWNEVLLGSPRLTSAVNSIQNISIVTRTGVGAFGVFALSVHIMTVVVLWLSTFVYVCNSMIN